MAHLLAARRRDIVPTVRDHVLREDHPDAPGASSPAAGEDVFTAFTALAGMDPDLPSLLRAASRVLDEQFPGQNATYHEWRGGAWRTLTWAAPAGPVDAGRPEAQPVFAEAVATRQPAYHARLTPDLGEGGPVCAYPLCVGGAVLGVLTVRRPAGQRWRGPDRLLMHALGRSLTVVLERAAAAHSSRALEAFAQLSRDLATETDRLLLVRRAQRIMQGALPAGQILYCEPEGGGWTVRSAVGPEAPVTADGLPFDPLVLAQPWTSRQPLYLDRPGRGPQAPQVPLRPVEPLAALPLLLNGEPVGVLTVALSGPHLWTAQERAMLETTMRHLSLALERADRIAQLNAYAHEAFVAFTEAAGTETNVLELGRQAVAVLHARFPDASAAYYEREAHLWKARVWTPDINEQLAALISAGLPDTPLTREVSRTRAAVFVDAWDEGTQEVQHSSEYATVTNVPLIIGGRVHGILALALRRARPWTEPDKTLVRAVARGLNLSLERSEQARQLQEDRAALEAFAAFTEHAGSETDRLSLAREAIRVVRSNLAQVSAAYYELDDHGWRARVWSDNVAPEVAGQLGRDVPEDAPGFAGALTRGEAVFVDRWDASAHAAPAAATSGAAAFVPLTAGGETRGMFAVRVPDARVWLPREKAIIRAIGRGLGLAIDRAQTARQLRAQNAELGARTRALEGFAALTRELGVRASEQDLVRRAQEVVLSLLPAGYALYYERDGAHWRNRVQVGEVRNPDLQAFIDAGPRVGETPSVDVPWTTRRALYQDEYARGSDTPLTMVGHVNAAASLPVFRNGEPTGVFIAVLFEQRTWSPADRVVLETVVGSLGLALERAGQARQLEAQRAELEARNQVLSAFEDWTRDLSAGIEPLTLIRRAQALLYDLLPVQAAVYYERDGDRWWVRSMLGHYGSDGLRLAHEAGLPDELTGTLRTPAQTGQVLYVEPFDPALDGLGEHMTHVKTTAMLPLMAAGVVRGVFGLARFDQARWSATERTVIETVGRSLELAIDRADKATALERERAALAARTAELAAANEELEAFAYSVSHDLRAPVRHIAGFNALLRTALGPTLDARPARYLQVVDDAAQRMNTLIDAMLELSRTTRQPLKPEPVNLNALVQQAQRDSEPDLLGRTVRWEVGALPVVPGDPNLLRQVMDNLLANALKYTRGREVAVIRVWAEDRPAETAVFVADNGVGFDPRHAGKLFGVFQRLHRADEFEGTGVGLANVRRIIQRHGGQVFARSDPGAGAAFGFVLPKDRPAL
ncbi:GAF domain-containing protein (plasmid) [Deinococcus taeanensis]|uniref:GAF domain-containing protein n=1 Tax=Deinococcus taeanensis TaxID=2737050 RepID=UPI001CDC7921|nr:GAF domain-containing protein [Deinococcus taeanensis]UBV44337.1 GAF domain-containing protein [Deinococcus taeanensis]